VTQTYWGQDRDSDIELLIDTTTILLICIRKHEHLRLVSGSEAMAVMLGLWLKDLNELATQTLVINSLFNY
jgi:hypothetical protein